METVANQANPTTTAPSAPSDASTLSRLEAFLTPDEEKKPINDNQKDTDNSVEEVDAQPAKTDESESTDESEQDSESPNTYELSDVAKLLGADESSLDVDDDGNVLVKTKIDGQEGKAKFSDLLKSYQLQGHVDKQVREVAEQKKALEYQSQNLQQQMQVQQALISQIGEVKSIESELVQYLKLDQRTWNDWYDSDPIAAAKGSHYMQSLQANYNSKMNEIKQAEHYLHTQTQESNNAYILAEGRALLEKVTEMADAIKAKAIQEKIVNDLVGRKISSRTAQIIDNNHELFLLARDAMLYRQSQSGNKAIEKTVRAAPKIIKPGTSQSKNTQTNVQKLHSEVKRSGSRQSVHDYLIATGKV